MNDVPDRLSARIELLDGWRALSILCVLVGHWLPVSLPGLHFNEMVAATGMALFFILSGFLIVRVLLTGIGVPAFLTRRLFRIAPLALLATLILYLVTDATRGQLLANLFFYANLPPSQLLHGGEHFWSLCVEVQFYAGIALLVAIAGRRGLWLVPALCLAVTAARIWAHEPISIVTWHRVDEILAGASLALLLQSGLLPLHPRRSIPSWTCVMLFGLLLLSAWDATGPWQYLRPYLAAATIGTSLFAAPNWLHRLWTSRPARYVAEVSYAVYVVHGMLTTTWLGQGDRLAKYLKRPVLAAATFAVAHVSTYRFEMPITRLGKRLTQRYRARPATEAAPLG